MIRLTKNKAIYSNQFNPESEQYVEREVDKIWPYLNEELELCDGFTLADLFSFIEKEKDVFDVIFNSQLGHHPLQPFMDEIKNPGPDEDGEIDYLEVKRFGEYFEGDIELSIGFGGVNEKTDMGYGIEYTSLNRIKHLSLRLNHDFSIAETKIPSKFKRCFIWMLKKTGILLKRWRSPFSYVYIKGETCFTLHELLSAVLYEISFVGIPEERDKCWNEVEIDIAEAIKGLKEAGRIDLTECEVEIDALRKSLEEEE